MIYHIKDSYVIGYIAKKLMALGKESRALSLDKLGVPGILHDTIRKVDSSGRLYKDLKGDGVYFARTSIEPHISDLFYGEQMLCWNNKSKNMILIDKEDFSYAMSIKPWSERNCNRGIIKSYKKRELKEVLMEAFRLLSE